jgi:hypothetical protein
MIINPGGGAVSPSEQTTMKSGIFYLETPTPTATTNISIIITKIHTIIIVIVIILLFNFFVTLTSDLTYASPSCRMDWDGKYRSWARNMDLYRASARSRLLLLLPLLEAIIIIIVLYYYSGWDG